MKGQLEHFLENPSQHNSKLQGVFNKISDIWQHQNPIPKQMSPEVKGPILPERLNLPSVEFGYCVDDAENGIAVQALTRRLEEELRAAKTRHLECGEVLLPADLLPMIARDVFRMAESEPCGLRGCTLYLNYETDQLCRKIGRVECDPGRVSTFELFLTLRHDSSSWYTLLPQFLKNWTSGRTIVLGHGFTLEKKKLYRSYRE
uniref:(California timema) hypothetical protein n=1 Tax=Timema californicum TaxID=61474 RepID=A0A7R9PCP5_TIMCA|nr:unnamed protein product [Timema californicum]